MAKKSRIDILAPGILGPVPIPPEGVPASPILGRVLGRADCRSSAGGDFVSNLMGRFGMAAPEDRDLPSAPFCLMSDSEERDAGGFVLHADPVHLRPDRDRLLLLDSRYLALTEDEADALAALFNEHFASDGLYLEVPTPERWYLRVQEAPHLRTTSLDQAAGRSVNHLLPRGKDAPRWGRILNEAQMLFHHSGVNQAREREGRLSVSGIWLWGGGTIPPRLSPPECDRVCAAHPLALGLATATGLPVDPVPGDAADLLDGARTLLVLDMLLPAVADGDGTAWREGVERLESLLAPLVRALGSGRLASLGVDPCNGECYGVGRWGMRRFWRSSQDLAARVAPSA